MKKFTYLFFLLASVLFTSCEKYLDRQPDDALTSKDIFKKITTTRNYLMNVYSFSPQEHFPAGLQTPWVGSADESSVSYISRGFGAINKNLWTPSSNNYSGNLYGRFYPGIREATYFMQHVYECEELSDGEKLIWYNEARFLRAYFYYNLMRVYGPVFILGNDMVDFNDTDLGERERNTWDECVNFVVNELEESAKALPQEWGAEWYGRATRGAAMATKARLLLYSARPLFNGSDLYKGVKSKIGENLFPVNNDQNKWKLAADASKAIIDLGIYSLMGEAQMDAPNYDPYKSLEDLYNTRTISNKEIIFSNEGDAYEIRRTTVPQVLKGYGGVGPTQKLVDAFAMNNGKYPITGYTNNGATPIIDAGSGYSETGFSNYVHPIFKTNLNTYKMYQNREPRFYKNVFWSGLTWIDANGTRTTPNIQFYRNGNSGPGSSHNYPTTGYLTYKFIDKSIKYGEDAYGAISFPTFRYAETLLNYAEALNEYAPGDPNILIYLNKVRKRAGVPDLETVYPQVVGDQAKMREMIRKERMIELCFENHRFFDTRTWMIADKENNGPVYGMNVFAMDHNPTGDYWKRTVLLQDGGHDGNRVFTPKSYLFPFPEKEVTLVKFTQNYGW